MSALGALLLLLLLSNFAQSQSSNQAYDSTLAAKLGADEYGMKKYVFVLLKTGDNKTDNKAFIDSCFNGHLKNIRRLADNKQLAVAGPFGKNNNQCRGLFILNVNNIEDAEALLKTDPAIASNLLKAELYPWYGSAALPEYLPVHDKIWKENP